MPLHRSTVHSPSAQRGAVFIIMVVILVMGTAAFFVSSLTSVGSSLQRDQVTIEVLNQAKQALIAYAINSENIGGSAPRPGDLPCPDTDAPGSGSNYGYEEATCAAGALGRLPWKTLGLPELKDSVGEPLWYSVSGNFRRSGAGGIAVLNSDTAGTLDVYSSDGATLLTSASDKAVAVVFAPGPIVGAQVRGTTAEKTTASNYLEVGPGSRNNATTGGPFVAAPTTTTFNDKLTYVTASQLLPSIEKRVGTELKTILKTYYTAWGAFPFAGPFANPSTATFAGTAGTTYGLPPIGNLNSMGTTTTPVWNAIPTATFTGGSGTATCTRRPTSCTTACTYWRCDLTSISGTPTITISGRLNNIGFGMWRLYDPTASITGTPEVGVRISPSTTYNTASSVMDNVSVTASLTSAGYATVVFSGKVRLVGTPTRIQLYTSTIPAYSLPTWFAVNNWNHVMYYATSPGYAPGGGNSCNPLPGTPSCLTVSGQGGVTNARAVVVTTGAALASQAAHPSATLTNYLELENATPADFIYENQTRIGTFNDQVIVVAP